MLMAVPSTLVKVRMWLMILTYALQMCNSRLRINKLTCFSVLQLHVVAHTQFSYVTLKLTARTFLSLREVCHYLYLFDASNNHVHICTWIYT